MEKFLFNTFKFVNYSLLSQKICFKIKVHLTNDILKNITYQLVQFLYHDNNQGDENLKQPVSTCV